MAQPVVLPLLGGVEAAVVAGRPARRAGRRRRRSPPSPRARGSGTGPLVRGEHVPPLQPRRAGADDEDGEEEGGGAAEEEAQGTTGTWRTLRDAPSSSSRLSHSDAAATTGGRTRVMTTRRAASRGRARWLVPPRPPFLHVAGDDDQRPPRAGERDRHPEGRTRSRPLRGALVVVGRLLPVALLPLPPPSLPPVPHEAEHHHVRLAPPGRSRPCAPRRPAAWRGRACALRGVRAEHHRAVGRESSPIASASARLRNEVPTASSVPAASRTRAPRPPRARARTRARRRRRRRWGRRAARAPSDAARTARACWRTAAVPSRSISDRSCASRRPSPTGEELAHVAREHEGAHLGAEQRPRPRLHRHPRLVEEDGVEVVRVQLRRRAGGHRGAHHLPRRVVAHHLGAGRHAVGRERQRRDAVHALLGDDARVQVGGARVGGGARVHAPRRVRAHVVADALGERARLARPRRALHHLDVVARLAAQERGAEARVRVRELQRGEVAVVREGGLVVRLLAAGAARAGGGEEGEARVVGVGGVRRRAPRRRGGRRRVGVRGRVGSPSSPSVFFPLLLGVPSSPPPSSSLLLLLLPLPLQPLLPLLRRLRATLSARLQPLLPAPPSAPPSSPPWRHALPRRLGDLLRGARGAADDGEGRRRRRLLLVVSSSSSLRSVPSLVPSSLVPSLLPRRHGVLHLRHPLRRHAEDVQLHLVVDDARLVGVQVEGVEEGLVGPRGEGVASPVRLCRSDASSPPPTGTIERWGAARSAPTTSGRVTAGRQRGGGRRGGYVRSLLLGIFRPRRRQRARVRVPKMKRRRRQEDEAAAAPPSPSSLLVLSRSRDPPPAAWCVHALARLPCDAGRRRSTAAAREAERGRDWVWAWCVRTCRAAARARAAVPTPPPSVRPYVLLTPPDVDADASEYPPSPCTGPASRRACSPSCGASPTPRCARRRGGAPAVLPPPHGEEARRLLGGDASLLLVVLLPSPRARRVHRPRVRPRAGRRRGGPAAGGALPVAREGGPGWHDDLASLRPVPVLLRERRAGLPLPPPLLRRLVLPPARRAPAGAPRARPCSSTRSASPLRRRLLRLPRAVRRRGVGWRVGRRGRRGRREREEGGEGRRKKVCRK